MIRKITSLFIILAFPVSLVSCVSKEDLRNIEKDQKIFFDFPISIKNKSINENVKIFLNKKLNNRMLFGPEALILKKIVIFNDNSKSYEGWFSEDEKSIFINTNIAFKNKIDNNYDLAEYIFQLVSHEFKHFQANIYLNNIKDNSLTTSNIFLNNKEQKWPKAYIDKFKNLLNYNINSKKYTNQEIKPGFVSLGSVYNQKELYDIANSKNLNFKLKGNEVMAPLLAEVPVDKKHIIKNQSLKYLYSMEELYARKNQLASESFFVTKKNKNGLNKNGWFINNEKKFWSPYLQDVVNFKRNYQENKGEYLHDNPLGKNRELLTNLFKESINYNIEGLTILEFERDKTKIAIGGQTNIKFKPEKLVVKDSVLEKSYDLKNISKIKNNWIANNVLISDILNKDLYLEDAFKNRVIISELKSPIYGAPSTFKFNSNLKDNYFAKKVNGKVRIFKSKNSSK